MDAYIAPPPLPPDRNLKPTAPQICDDGAHALVSMMHARIAAAAMVNSVEDTATSEQVDQQVRTRGCARLHLQKTMQDG